MKIDSALQSRVDSIFRPLNSAAASQSFPKPATLSTELEHIMPATGLGTVGATPKIASYFASAAVDIWLRAVHSFLISASLTSASPVWASATGYYASHYAVRALAHILGHFMLFKKRRAVFLDLTGGYSCTFSQKTSSDGEHHAYWRIVKLDSHFAGDPLFTTNDVRNPLSDASHRNFANYADHLQKYPTFSALDLDTMKRRARFISQIEFSAPQIPDRDRFPDIEAVQVIAYFRIVAVRQLLDAILGGTQRFWSVYRKPAWVGDVIDFQVIDPTGLSVMRTLSGP